MDFLSGPHIQGELSLERTHKGETKRKKRKRQCHLWKVRIVQTQPRNMCPNRNWMIQGIGCPPRSLNGAHSPANILILYFRSPEVWERRFWSLSHQACDNCCSRHKALCIPPGSHRDQLSMEFSRKQYWSGLPFPSPGDFPEPRVRI